MEMGTPRAHLGILHLNGVAPIAIILGNTKLFAEVDVEVLVVIIVFGFIVVSSRFFVVSSFLCLFFCFN